MGRLGKISPELIDPDDNMTDLWRLQWDGGDLVELVMELWRSDWESKLRMLLPKACSALPELSK